MVKRTRVTKKKHKMCIPVFPRRTRSPPPPPISPPPSEPEIVFVDSRVPPLPWTILGLDFNEAFPSVPPPPIKRIRPRTIPTVRRPFIRHGALPWNPNSLRLRKELAALLTKAHPEGIHAQTPLIQSIRRVQHLSELHVSPIGDVRPPALPKSRAAVVKIEKQKCTKKKPSLPSLVIKRPPRLQNTIITTERKLGENNQSPREERERLYPHQPIQFELIDEGRIGELIDYLHDNPHMIHAEDTREAQLLHWCAMRDQYELAQMLLFWGADIHARDYSGNTPLTTAALFGNVRMVKLYLEAGGDVNTQTFQGHTALCHTATHNHVEVCKVLLEHGARTDTKTCDGYTPLHIAALMQNYPICKILVAHKKVEIDAIDDNGDTPLMTMIRNTLLPPVDRKVAHEKVLSFFKDIEFRRKIQAIREFPGEPSIVKQRIRQPKMLDILEELDID